MDFRPLYKPERHLFAIGVQPGQGQLDGACYDLLASESCLTSYLTVARGDAPRRHWFQLGRPYIRAAGRIGLISWGGTMFEYLMPRLLLRSLPETLLAEACRTAVARQIEYGRRAGHPLGDLRVRLQRAVPRGRLPVPVVRRARPGPEAGAGAGPGRRPLRHGHGDDDRAPRGPGEPPPPGRRRGRGPIRLLRGHRLTRPNGCPRTSGSAVVRSYMAHHQGMSLVALTNALLDDLMPRRFHAEPMVRAAELLLQERIPADSPIVETGAREPAAGAADRPPGTGSLLSRRLTTPSTSAPRTHLLSNTHYHVMVTNAGSGYSRCQGLDVTRWREDPTCEAWGQFCLHPRPSTGARLVGRTPAGLPSRPTSTRWSSPPTRRRSAGATATSRPCSRSPSRPSSPPRSAGSR